jgi:hypothetical protein
MKSEYDANQWLSIVDPLEETQRMPIADRRYRQREAAGQHVCNAVADEVQRQLDAQVDGLVCQAARANISGWIRDFRDGDRRHTLTVHEIAQQGGFSDGTD